MLVDDRAVVFEMLVGDDGGMGAAQQLGQRSLAFLEIYFATVAMVKSGSSGGRTITGVCWFSVNWPTRRTT